MPFLGEFSALLTACFWSGSSMAFASATKRVGTFQVNVTRLMLAAGYLVLLIAALRFDITMSVTQVASLSVSGVIGLALGDTFLFKAYEQVGARITMLFMSLAPAIAAGLAFWLLGEGISITGVLGMLITLLGISIVVFEPGLNESPGISLTTAGITYALFAALGQGAGLVVAKMAFRESTLNGFVATAVRILASLIVLLPFALMTKRYSHPYRTFSRDRKAFLLTVIGSVFGPFLGITSSLIAIEHTSVGIAATIMATVPILMLPLVRIIYKERLTWRAITGAFIAVAGVAVLFLR
ncbi:MAG: DMT family transporter [Bacteroidota bacterium]|jgi:drug/metabolite transporter (DMT)-like permease